jgi:hypothetical protein
MIAGGTRDLVNGAAFRRSHLPLLTPEDAVAFAEDQVRQALAERSD